MAKQNHLSRVDSILFIVGSISVTFVATFIANGFFKGRAELLLLETVLYVSVLAVYIQAFRASRTGALVQLARIISYAGIITAILIVSSIAYFVTNFRW